MNIGVRSDQCVKLTKFHSISYLHDQICNKKTSGVWLVEDDKALSQTFKVNSSILFFIARSIHNFQAVLPAHPPEGATGLDLTYTWVGLSYWIPLLSTLFHKISPYSNFKSLYATQTQYGSQLLLAWNMKSLPPLQPQSELDNVSLIDYIWDEDPSSSSSHMSTPLAQITMEQWPRVD